MGEPTFERIRPRTRRLGSRLVHLASVDSTMAEADRLAEQGAPDGTVVVADAQTQGRGRAGRAWHSPKGSLHATVLLRGAVPADRVPWIPLVAGLSLARSIERLLKVPAALKWPNDVWIDGRKVAGVLVESRSAGAKLERVLVGIGVNGDARPEDFPPELRTTATSLSQAAGRHVCLPALLKLLLEDLEKALDELTTAGPGRLEKEVAARSLVLGREVRARTAAGEITGTAVGLGPTGELLVKTTQGTVAVLAGDCELLRPV